ncbi:unnamed protein product, partial [Notodromas monacha]
MSSQEEAHGRNSDKPGGDVDANRADRSPLVRLCQRQSSVPLVTTFLLMGSYVSYGMVVGVIGPTILDLALVLDKTLTDVSFLVMTRPLGTSLGAILSPLCCRRMNPFLFLFAVTLLSGVSLVATPFSRDVYLTSFFLGLAGLGTGLLSTGSNIYMLDMWSDKALPWLQATYGLLGVGALVAPLISAPFLLETPANDDDQGAPGGISNSSTSVLAAAEGTNETQVHYAYVIIGGFTILTSLTFLVQWMCVGNYKFSGRIAHRDSKKARIENSDAVDLREERNRRILKVLIIMTACFFFFVLVYSEVGLVLMPIKQHYADLVVPFAHYSDLQMPKKEAANINSFYWAAYTAARLASAVLAIKMGPFKTLLIEFVIGTIGTLLLLFFANHSVTWLWIGSGLLAIGRAAIYAAGIAHLER